MVHKKWIDKLATFSQSSYSLDRWHECLQSLRQFLRGWELKNAGARKTAKLEITKRVEMIDKIAEERLLTMEEWEERISLDFKIEEMAKWDEAQWKQKDGKNWVMQGDANTHFFHQYVNGRRRKHTIAFLESDSGEIRGQKEITKHIVDYYKSLFGHNDHCSMHLGENFWPD